MQWGSRRGFTFLAIAALVGAAIGCAERVEDSGYLMHEEYFDDGSGERYLGGGCQVLAGEEKLSSETGAVGEGPPPYALSHVSHDDRIRVKVTGPDGEQLTERRYDRGFVLSGETDEFTVSLAPDRYVRLLYWGGPECVPPRAPAE